MFTERQLVGGALLATGIVLGAGFGVQEFKEDLRARPGLFNDLNVQTCDQHLPNTVLDCDKVYAQEDSWERYQAKENTLEGRIRDFSKPVLTVILLGAGVVKLLWLDDLQTTS